MLAGSGLAQEGVLVPEPAPPASQAPPYCCPPLTCPECRQCGNVPQPDLAIPPESWPVPCDNCKPCDPLQTGCPDRTDFFLLPPRPAWYVISDGAAITRKPSHGNDFASLGLLPTGATGPTDVVLSTEDFSYDFRAAGRVHEDRHRAALVAEPLQAGRVPRQRVVMPVSDLAAADGAGLVE